MAIGLQRGEVRIAVVAQIHFHAVDDVLEMALREVEGPYHRDQCLRDRMLSRTGEGAGNLVAPPCELGARYFGIRALVHYVIHFAAERVKRGDRAPPLRRQEQEAVIKARSALRSLVLTVLFGRHRYASRQR